MKNTSPSAGARLYKARHSDCFSNHLRKMRQAKSSHPEQGEGSGLGQPAATENQTLRWPQGDNKYYRSKPALSLPKG